MTRTNNHIVSRLGRLVANTLAHLTIGSLALGAAAIATAGTASATPSWAGPSFCASYHVAYMGHSYDGVAACGNAYPNNTQGYVGYNGVEFDSVGFQCYELAARYFYAMTGLRPPVQPNASDLAYYIHADYPQYSVYPAGITGSTDRYAGSLVDGSIISMWSSSDEVGHVAIVTSVDLNSAESGTILVLDENGSSNGVDRISVDNGVMNFEGLYNQFQWVSGFSSVSTPPAPTYYTYQVVGTAQLAEQTGPSTADPAVGWLPDHATIQIACQTTGSTVVSSNIWDKLANGSYIADWYTTTPGVGRYSPPIPVC